jgi:hypothetical protein
MEITFKLYADRQQSDWGIATGKSVSTASQIDAAMAECFEKFPTNEGWFGHTAITALWAD